MKKILVVGAGFAGAVYARTLAEAGYQVDVIDRRSHIAGNCYDYEHVSGVRVHKYGPHLFHTSNQKVVNWLSQFTEWVDYSHTVVAKLPDQRLVPLPVNRTTINETFGLELKTAEEVKRFLDSVSTEPGDMMSAEDWLYANIGKRLTDLYFRPYTKKMWDLDLRDVAASVVQRIKIRTDDDARYFPDDSFQAMPKNGYESLFRSILSYPGINVKLETEFDRMMLDDYTFCFNSMPIDVYFDYSLGELPYRSIRFHVSSVDALNAPTQTTINYTDDGPFTRETWWHNIPEHLIRSTGLVCRTVEEPCDYKENNYERYYPIKTPDDQFENIYKQYVELASSISNLQFIGRCGTYQYLDMHQVINQSLIGAVRWLQAHS